MALSVNHHQLVETQVDCTMTASGATPAVMRAPFRGRIVKIGCTTGAAVATSSAILTWAVNGTNVTGGTVSLTSALAANTTVTSTITGSINSSSIEANGFVKEDDAILVTPSGGATGAAGSCVFVVIKKMG